MRLGTFLSVRLSKLEMGSASKLFRMELCHRGFQFLVCSSPNFLRVPGHLPSVVMSQFAILETPLKSMHFWAKRSSPMGPHLVAHSEAQSMWFWHQSMLLRRVSNAL